MADVVSPTNLPASAPEEDVMLRYDEESDTWIVTIARAFKRPGDLSGEWEPVSAKPEDVA